MPYFNRQINDDLIFSIQSAGAERRRNGFSKNKNKEKQPESQDEILEHRTNDTDAFDTLHIGCAKFSRHNLYPIFYWWNEISMSTNTTQKNYTISVSYVPKISGILFMYKNITKFPFYFCSFEKLLYLCHYKF